MTTIIIWHCEFLFECALLLTFIKHSIVLSSVVDPATESLSQIISAFSRVGKF